MGELGYYYNQFLSWADEFQNSTLEQRKMIACQLIRGVKVSRGYNVNIEFDMNYRGFVIPSKSLKANKSFNFLSKVDLQA